MKILCINSKPDLSFFTKRGLVLDVSYDTCDKVFPPIKMNDVINTVDGKDTVIPIYSPDVYSYLNEKYKENYHFILFGWNPKDYNDDFKHTGGQAFMKKLSSGARYATVRQDGGNYEVHEMMHLLVHKLYYDLKKYDVTDAMDTTFVNGLAMRYYKNNDPEAPDGNFAVTWDSIKKYVPLLNSLDTMPTYKYFTAKEIVGLKPALVAKLDEARGYAGIPFVIESGLRTPVQNSALPDDVSNSAHLKGLAVDLRARDSVSRWKIVNSLLKAGFTRIGIGKNFVHADLDTSLPQNVMWHYY